MQQRQSADTFIFPIVKAFLVSQNNPTNRGVNELLFLRVLIICPCRYVLGCGDVYQVDGSRNGVQPAYDAESGCCRM